MSLDKLVIAGQVALAGAQRVPCAGFSPCSSESRAQTNRNRRPSLAIVRVTFRAANEPGAVHSAQGKQSAPFIDTGREKVA